MVWPWAKRTRAYAGRPRTPASRRGRGIELAFDALLCVLIVTGLVYLVPNPGGRAGQTDESTESLGSLREPPRLTYVTTEEGVRKARLDVVRLTAWCRSLGLPDPPRLESAEPAVGESLMEALVELAKDPCAATFGQMGKISENLECHDIAEEYFRRAAEADPQDFRWAYYLGCIQQLTGRNSEAIETFQKVIRLNPGYETSYARLGQLYLEAGQDDDAAWHLRRYIELRPEDSLGYVGLARVALRGQEHETALSYLRTGIQWGANDFQCHYYLARAYAAVGEDALARKHFAISEKLPQGAWFYPRDPLDQELHASADSVRLAEREFERLRGSGDWPKLAGLAERILTQRPGDAMLLLNLSRIYAKMGRYADAHAILDRAIEIRPQEAELRFTRAQVYFFAKDFEAAIRASDEALERDAAHPGAFSIRGRSLYVLGRNTAAAEAMRRSVELNRSDPSTALLLADVLRESGMSDEAAEYYETVLELDPGHTTARERLAEIRRPHR